jgi:hypothetical protein
VFSFEVERSVFLLGSRLMKPDASSSVRRALAAESNPESLAVASVIAATYSLLEGRKVVVGLDGSGGRL